MLLPKNVFVREMAGIYACMSAHTGGIASNSAIHHVVLYMYIYWQCINFRAFLSFALLVKADAHQ